MHVVGIEFDRLSPKPIKIHHTDAKCKDENQVFRMGLENIQSLRIFLLHGNFKVLIEDFQ